MIRRSLIRVALVAGAVATVAACGGSSHGSTGSPATSSNPAQEQQGWLGSDATSVTFLQWVENPDHTLTGQIDQFSTIPDNTFTAAITGVHRGSSVSLTVSAIGLSYTANGTLQVRTLTLNFAQPDGTIETETFRPASVAQYNSEVRTMQGKLGFSRRTSANAQITSPGVVRTAPEAEAVAAATATAQARAAAIAANKQRTCTAINGHVDATTYTPWGWCISNVSGDPSGQPGADCKLSSVAFNSDGTLDRLQIETENLFYPGCFPQAKDVPYDVSPCVRALLAVSNCR